MIDFINHTLKSFRISGQVEKGTRSDGFETIYVVLKNGYRVDLIARLMEMRYTYGNTASVRFWQAASEFDTLQAIAAIAAPDEASGSIDTDFEVHTIQYSEYTSDVSYNTDFWVGGHNLWRTIQDGQYIIFDAIYTMQSTATWDDVDMALSDEEVNE